MFTLDVLMESHRLLPFHGVRLCITGIETADVRARIHKLIKRNGGEYLKALDKTCTHVLCATHDTEKVNFANKTNREREILKIHSGSQDVPEPIQLVWEAWFWDCIYMKGNLIPHVLYIALKRF
jgi:DNA replication regulator DPB11